MNTYETIKEKLYKAIELIEIAGHNDSRTYEYLNDFMDTYEDEGYICSDSLNKVKKHIIATSQFSIDGSYDRNTYLNVMAILSEI